VTRQTDTIRRIAHEFQQMVLKRSCMPPDMMSGSLFGVRGWNRLLRVTG
jgi:hypothetical protein